MIRDLINQFRSRWVNPPSPQDMACRVRHKARTAYLDACSRKDSRDKNKTLYAYQEATRECLRLGC